MAGRGVSQDGRSCVYDSRLGPPAPLFAKVREMVPVQRKEQNDD